MLFYSFINCDFVFFSYFFFSLFIAYDLLLPIIMYNTLYMHVIYTKGKKFLYHLFSEIVDIAIATDAVQIKFKRNHENQLIDN